MPTTFFIIRHGKSKGNVERRLQGRDNSPLSDLGKEQCSKLRERLDKVDFDLVYYSPLERTKSTAEELFKRRNIPLLEDSGLIERDFGKLDGLTIDESKKLFPEAERIYDGEDVPAKELGVESISDVKQRVEKTLKRLAEQNPEKRVVLITHMFWIKSILTELLQKPYGEIRKQAVYNTSLTILNGNKEDFEVVSSGDDSHLKDFILVRHGETDWNKVGKLQGQANKPLNGKGQKQAEKIAKELENTNIRTIYSSDLERAVETAEIINKKHCVKIIQDSLLREIDLGKFEGLTREEIKQKHPELYKQKKADLYSFKRPEGESYADLEKRIEKFLEKIESTEKPVLIVSHQATIRTLIGLVAKMDKKEMMKIGVPQETIYFLDSKKQKITYSENGLMKKGFLERSTI